MTKRITRPYCVAACIRTAVILALLLGVFIAAANAQITVPAANFKTSGASAEEGGGTTTATVTFSLDFVGTLNYAVSGTATSGARFQTLPGSVAVNGGSASIPITLIDDSIAGQQIETLTLALSPGSGYSVGGLNQFTLSILDNDGIWYGRLDGMGGSVQFEVTIVRAPSGAAGTLVEDGNGTYPAGTYGVAIVFPSPTSFDAQTVAIPMAASDTALGVAFTRRLHLVAGVNGGLVSGDLIQGTFEETLTATAVADQYLFPHPIKGTFTLTREIARPNSVEPRLIAKQVAAATAGGNR